MERFNKRETEIKFSSISPLELWENLGLAQPSRKKEQKMEEIFSLDSLDQESRMAFEAFRQDCPLEEEEMEERFTIKSEKGSLFIWALLKQCSNRSKTHKKLSSICHLFKDDVFATARYVGRKYKISFEEKDFDEISKFLVNKDLVRTSKDGIRITRKVASLFHQKYHAWLVF